MHCSSGNPPYHPEDNTQIHIPAVMEGMSTGPSGQAHQDKHTWKEGLPGKGWLGKA